MEYGPWLFKGTNPPFRNYNILLFTDFPTIKENKFIYIKKKQPLKPTV